VVTGMAWREVERILSGPKNLVKLIAVSLFLLIIGGAWWRADPSSKPAEFVAAVGALFLFLGLLYYLLAVLKKEKLFFFE